MFGTRETSDNTEQVVINLRGKHDDKLPGVRYSDLSDNGNFVVVTTYGGSVGYRLNLKTGQRRLLARTAAGDPAGGISSVSVSRSGRFVAFTSRNDNILRRDKNGRSDAFRVDMRTGKTTLVSQSWRGTSANRGTRLVSISADGTRVAIETDASNLIKGDRNRNTDIYVRGLQGDRNYRVTVPHNGRPIRGGLRLGEISPNGQAVVFFSTAGNLVAGDANHTYDVFVRY